MEKPLNAFISSTTKDLSAYRSASKDVILSMGWHPVLVNEHQLVTGGPTLQKCAELVWNADVFVLLVGHRCGFIPPTSAGGSGQMSITQFETAVWEAAVQQQQKQSPVIFMSTHPTLQPGDGEGAVAAASQLLFRDRIGSALFKHDFEFWPDGDSRQVLAVMRFAADLKTQLATVKAQRAAAQVAEVEARIKAQEAARRQLESANRVLTQRAQEAGANLVVGSLIGLFIAALLSNKK